LFWEHRRLDDDDVTVDGTHLETIEYKPFNSGRVNDKLNALELGIGANQYCQVL